MDAPPVQALASARLGSCQSSRPPTRKQKPQRRLNVSGLGRSADLSSLRAAISSNLAQVSDCSPLSFQSSSDAAKQWDTLSKAVMDAAVDTLGYSTRKHQDWFDSNDGEIQTLLNERNTAFAAKLRNPNSVELQRRWALQRSHCKNDCAKWRTHGGSPRLLKYRTMRMQIWRISFMRQ